MESIPNLISAAVLTIIIVQVQDCKGFPVEDKAINAINIKGRGAC